jgi:hypothetical protein
VQAVWLFEAVNAARNKYFVDPRREARGWRVTPVIAAEQQVRGQSMHAPVLLASKCPWPNSALQSISTMAVVVHVLMCVYTRSALPIPANQTSLVFHRWSCADQRACTHELSTPQLCSAEPVFAWVCLAHLLARNSCHSSERLTANIF